VDNVSAAHRQRLCVLLTCDRPAEADLARLAVSQVNNTILATYRKSKEILASRPVGRAALVILAAAEEAHAVRRTLSWLRHGWPRCPVAVVGEAGSVEMELTARIGGASFLPRPVDPGAWTSIIHHALAKADRVTMGLGR
jgi:DNA-binding NtrC family response regulator